jgi:predicted transcriptional regulator YdeE
MNKTTITLPEIKLVGITTSTSNTQEMNQDTAKIGARMQKFFENRIQEKIRAKYLPFIPIMKVMSTANTLTF